MTGPRSRARSASRFAAIRGTARASTSFGSGRISGVDGNSVISSPAARSSTVFHHSARALAAVSPKTHRPYGLRVANTSRYTARLRGPCETPTDCTRIPVRVVSRREYSAAAVSIASPAAASRSAEAAASAKCSRHHGPPHTSSKRRRAFSFPFGDRSCPPSRHTAIMLKFISISVACRCLRRRRSTCTRRS